MGFFDALFSSDSDKGGPPKYLRDSYEKFGLDPDKEIKTRANSGKQMYCTMCRRIYRGGMYCTDCNNPLIEIK